MTIFKNNDSSNPLSWEEARSGIKSVLQDYMNSSSLIEAEGNDDDGNDHVIDKDKDKGKNLNSNNNNKNRILSWWFRNNVDVLMAVLTSIAALILSIASYRERKRKTTYTDSDNNGIWSRTTTLNASADLKVYASQIAASMIFLACSLISLWVIHMRSEGVLKGGNTKKRRAVSLFLRRLEKIEMNMKACDSNFSDKYENEMTTNKVKINNISGTSLTDIYSVYRVKKRFSSDSKREDKSCARGEWHRIPSLLLVKGDHIALQVGDVAPADCSLVNPFSSFNESTMIRAGDKIPPEINTKHKNGISTKIPNPGFPSGRSSLPPNSPKLLDLCRNMKIYVVEKSSLEQFLARTGAKHKSPQIHRQLKELRYFLHALSLGTLIVTLTLIFLRHGIASADLSLLLPLPLMGSLALLPTTSPLCIFLLEVIGTSRILVTAHPYASTRNSQETRPCESRHFLFLQYFIQTLKIRIWHSSLLSCFPKQRMLSFFDITHDSCLIDVPSAASCMFERLGVITALTLVDDELVCDPESTPQQLLIPSGRGLKLLDLCPKYADDVDCDDSGCTNKLSKRKHSRSFGSARISDSDSDNEPAECPRGARKTSFANITKRYREKIRESLFSKGHKAQPSLATDDMEVQFEDPSWWIYLPSLKCIGLTCLLVDNNELNQHAQKSNLKISNGNIEINITDSLISYVRQYYNRSHLLSLSHCIGFNTKPNAFGFHGDLTPFVERHRFHCITTRLVTDRLILDRHAIGLEESRNFGLLWPDATSVLVQDMRSKAYQLLTVGDARVVLEFCSDSWQGESSTISPLGNIERQKILESSKNWALGDLDVVCFSYAPIPFTLEQSISKKSQTDLRNKDKPSLTYLIDNRRSDDVPRPLPKGDNDDWSLMRNQIFLGLLGSSVSPKKEIGPFIEVCTDAGIRFVYFSPRNMRRTKELASQMGIDVAWNCAISLRPLDEGEEIDAHRMTSNYADWDVNARLPHGIENVKRHLEEVDNVPLLVSLYTDVTKHTTSEMVNVFQEYNDTVLALGLSHISSNDETFSVSDLSIGIDILMDANSLKCDISRYCSTSFPEKNPFESILPEEIYFVSSLVAHSCVLNLPCQSFVVHLSEIIAKGRISLDHGISAGVFLMTGYLSFTFFIILGPCTASSAVPYIPSVGSLFYLMFVLPLISFAISLSGPYTDLMDRVPIKNDETIIFASGERTRLYLHTVCRALLPSIAPHILYLATLGSLLIKIEPDFLIENCGFTAQHLENLDWPFVIRCDALREYSGTAKIMSGNLMIAELVLCSLLLSTSFVFRSIPLIKLYPWNFNKIWTFSMIVCISLLVLYLAVTLEDGTISYLPWYYFLLAILIPFLCLMISEILKQRDIKQEKRAAMLRRLQFETRLGMWSPK